MLILNNTTGINMNISKMAICNFIKYIAIPVWVKFQPDFSDNKTFTVLPVLVFKVFCLFCLSKTVYSSLDFELIKDSHQPKFTYE